MEIRIFFIRDIRTSKALALKSLNKMDKIEKSKIEESLKIMLLELQQKQFFSTDKSCALTLFRAGVCNSEPLMIQC